MALPLKPSDARRIRIAKKHGADFITRIIYEGRRVDLAPYTSLALIEQESNFRNVFGHDPTIFIGAGTVTEKKYKEYKRQRGHTRMQGVGPAQLTWWEYQDRADRLGGCWIPRHNIRVGFELLGALVKKHGLRKGLAIYNGGPNNPNWRYAAQVLDKRQTWIERFK